KARSEIEKNIDGLMTEIGWTVGRDGGKSLEGTAAVEMFDAAVELRDHHLLPAAAGVEIPEVEKLRTITMPPPRQREVETDGEEKSEDAQQTA
ncbi:MAG: hypothetical protein ACYS7M_08990, partial [Planctomycetota bacterium]